MCVGSPRSHQSGSYSREGVLCVGCPQKPPTYSQEGALCVGFPRSH